MFTKKSNIDIKKSTLKIQDSKKDSASRLRHLKTILEHVDIEEAKSLFETNYSHVYYILYDTFVQAEATLKQRGHKAHREELDSSLWLLGKILCYLPELIARRWQCHSIGRIMGTLLHHGNNTKLRKEGVRYFLLWYQALGENAPNQVHIMYTELVPGMFVPQKCQIGISDSVEFNTLDLMNHPNMKGEMGASVFHDTSVHQVKAPEIVPLLLPASNERSAAPDPKDGLEIILECMVQATGCLKWRDNTPQKHMKCFAFLLQRFKDIYLPMICVHFDYGTSLYEPKLDLPVMRTVHKRDELMSSCIVVLIHWIARYTRDKLLTTRFDQLQIDDNTEHLMGGNMNNNNNISGSISSGSAACEHLSLLTNLKYMGYSQQHLVRDVLFSTRENINFVIEMYRQAFLLNYSSKSEISAIRVAVSAYKDWMSNTPQPPFILEPETLLDGSVMDATQQQHQSTMSRQQQQQQQQQQQRLRTDSYLGAITKENLIVRAGLQNVIQIFVTHAANAFMIQTSPITALSPLKAPEITELDEQTDVCKSILNIYRSMVMNPHMDAKTWEQLLLVLLQITAVIVSQAPPNAKRSSLGGRLAQPVFQTLIVSWIRAHTLVPINITLWERFLNVLSSLTYREELIIEWYKTMLTLTRVMARQVYDLNLYDLPLDRVSEKKNKLRRGATTTHNNSSNSNNNNNNNESHNSGNISNSSVDMIKNTTNNNNSNNNRNSTNNIQNNKNNLKSYDANHDESQFSLNKELINSVPGTPSLNRSYSEGSLAPSVHNNGRHNNHRHRHHHNHHHHHQHHNGNHQHPRRSRPRKRLKSASAKVPTLSTNVEYSINRILSNQTPMSSINISISNETLKFNNVDLGMGNVDDNTLYHRNDQNDQTGIRRALSLDSVRPSSRRQPPNKCDDESESQRESRTPSPTASSGIDGGSIKDSPMQIDVIAGDTSSIDTQDEFSSTSADRRCVILGGLARGWQPDVTAIIWKWMLGSLGDINKILNPKLHAQVYRHLIEVTDCLIKIKQNQGISEDNQSTPAQPLLQPPINYITPWCYAAFQLDSQYRDGKLYALQLLCTIARYGPAMSSEQLPLFYNALHHALTGEDRAMAYTVLRYLGGSRFLSLLLPGHSLLILDLVHAATNIFQSFDISAVPRAEAAALLGSLLCFPKSSIPKPSIKPSEPNVVLMDCPEIQDHVLNVILRCARREPTSKARCIAIVSLGQWIIKNLVKSSSSSTLTSPVKVQRNFSQKTTIKTTPISSPSSSSTLPNTTFNPRIKEAIQVLLQALQFKHRTIARVAAETLKLCAERGKLIAQIERLPQLIINAICIALEIQNISNPKDSDKFVLMALLLCLGEFCMAIPIQLLMRPMNNNNSGSGQNENGGGAGGDSLIMIVLKILHQIATGSHTDRIKLFTADEDFDMSIAVDDVRVHKSDANYQTAETTQNCIAAIRLCAKTVAMHLVTNLGHFPMGIGASRLSSMVDEHDDMTLSSVNQSNLTDFNNIGSGNKTRNSNVDSIEFNGNTNQLNVITSKHLQMFLLNSGLIASFIELPALKLPGGGITAGLLTAERQVRVLLRDLNGKACWDASILYREPKLQITNVDLKSKNEYQQQSTTAHGGYHDQRTTFQMSSMNNNTSAAAAAASAQQQPAPPKPSRSFLIGSGGNMAGISGLQSMNTTSLDPLVSTIGMPIYPPQHTLRHRRPNQLPLAKDLAHDLDQLDDLLQYIGYTSPECLNSTTGGSQLNTASPTPLGQHLEAQTISIILGQRAVELDYVARNCNNFTNSQQQLTAATASISSLHSNESFIYGSASGGGGGGASNDNGNHSLLFKNDLPFHYCRLLFSQLGIAGWERRKRTNLLIRTEKLFRELKNLDKKFCRETHKMAVIYVANGQEDKNSILRNACGSSTYEMFVSALGWEVELETHNGFTGGLLQGCGSTSPYYATPFLEVIYHVATRMPCDTPDAILKKTKHLGNDEVHIVWSEHHRDYRRDILPTEFCDVLITVYPLKSGLFRVTVNRKPDVPWFGPLYDEAVVGGSCLASLVRATAINASRAKRISLPLHQQFYEERKRSLDTVATIHKDSNTFEEFAARVYTPIPFQNSILSGASNLHSTATTTTTAHALIDHQRGSTKLNRIQILPTDPLTTISSSIIIRGDAAQQQHTLSMALDHASPRPLRKLHPFIKSIPKQRQQQQLQQIGGSFIIHSNTSSGFNTPPDSPTLPGRKLKL